MEDYNTNLYYAVKIYLQELGKTTENFRLREVPQSFSIISFWGEDVVEPTRSELQTILQRSNFQSSVKRFNRKKREAAVQEILSAEVAEYAADAELRGQMFLDEANVLYIHTGEEMRIIS